MKKISSISDEEEPPILKIRGSKNILFRVKLYRIIAELKQINRKLCN